MLLAESLLAFVIATAADAPPSLSPQALVEELSKGALVRREQEATQKKLEEDKKALASERAAVDEALKTDRKSVV